MYQKYTTVPSETLPGAKVTIWRMTEGRRLELRKTLVADNARMRTIMREQDAIMKLPEADRELGRWWDLQDESDQIVLEKINPAYIRWGVKSVEGVVVGDETLTVDDADKWPSMFFSEVLAIVKGEVDLNGAERKNSPSPTTSGEPEDGNPKHSTAGTANGKGTTEAGTASSTSRVV